MKKAEPTTKWSVLPLQEIADINPSIDKSSITDDTIVPFVPMPAVEAETGKIDVSQTRRFSDVKKGYTPFQQNDVLFAKITPCMENGKIAVVPELSDGIGFGSTEFHVIRARRGIEPGFIYYYVSSKEFRFEAEYNMTGAVGQKRVPADFIKRQTIPVPPTKEQKRIVAKIEELFSELDRGVESLRIARDQLRVYRQSLLKHAFEGKLTADWHKHRQEEWQSICIRDAAEKIVDCLHSTPQFSATGRYCIDSTWVEDNKVLFDQARFVSENTYLERIVRLKPEKGDVVFVREGSKKIGTALVINFNSDCCLGQRMMMFRLSAAVVPQYFVYYVQSDGFKKQYKPLIGGSASPHLNISDIKNMQFPRCSIDEQNEIVKRIDLQFSVIDGLENEIGAKILDAETLRQSILKKAFSGKLVAQDPRDVPAKVLLERIHAEKNKNENTLKGRKKRAA